MDKSFTDLSAKPDQVVLAGLSPEKRPNRK